MKLHIYGGTPLCGTLEIESSKNALLPIIAGTILTNGITILRNVPRISDIDNMLKILINFNIQPRWQNGDLHIDTTQIAYNEIGGDIAGKIRGSTLLIGAIYGRFGRLVSLATGGCSIGARPIDLHLQALGDLKRKNDDIYLDFPSVGATENIILAAVIGRRRIRIHNAAREPEITDLCNFLSECGAKICGKGTSTITIIGVKALCGTTYTAIPDRINTGSYLIAAAVTGGNVTLTNVIPEHNSNLISKLRKAGCTITTTTSTISIARAGILRAVGAVHTAPYPGFPTDLQSQFAVLAAISRGITTISENLFENRFRYVPELCKIGAKICENGRKIVINGVKNACFCVEKRTKKGKNYGGDSAQATLVATDLRGGVALVIAGLWVDGKTVIENAEYIARGHTDIAGDMVKLGANVMQEY